MADVLGTSVSVSSGSDDTHYLPGHQRHDAIRVDIDSSNTTADDVTIEFRTYDQDDVRSAQSNGDFSSMETIQKFDNVDPSSGDPAYGVAGLSKVVAVNVNDNTGTGSDGVTATIHLHDSDDNFQSAESFVRRTANRQSFDSLELGGRFMLASTNRETLGSDKTIALSDPVAHSLDPDNGAGRNVDLPPEYDGLFYIIANRADAAEDLTVRDDGGSTIATVNQNDVGYFISDGTGWMGFSAAGGVD